MKVLRRILRMLTPQFILYFFCGICIMSVSMFIKPFFVSLICLIIGIYITTSSIKFLKQ